MAEAVPVILAQATWDEDGRRHRALVTPHPDDPARVLDLHRLERLRLEKLGEGDPKRLAEALVPPTLEPLLAGGARAFQRLRSAVEYGRSWDRKRGLPETVAPCLDQVRLRPCLPRPTSIRRYDGTPLEARLVGGPGASLLHPPVPTLALVGMHPGRPAGVCLALEDGAGVVLGGWLALGPLPEGCLELHHREDCRRFDLSHWQGLELPSLAAGEIVLLPPPILAPLAELGPGMRFRVEAPFERMTLRLSRTASHPTVQ